MIGRIARTRGPCSSVCLPAISATLHFNFYSDPPIAHSDFHPPHLSLAGWSGRESWMPSLVSCQRSQTPVLQSSDLFSSATCECAPPLSHVRVESAHLLDGHLSQTAISKYQLDDRGKSADYKLIFCPLSPDHFPLLQKISLTIGGS